MGTVGMCIRIPGQRRLRERRRASFPFSAEAAPEMKQVLDAENGCSGMPADETGGCR